MNFFLFTQVLLQPHQITELPGKLSSIPMIVLQGFQESSLVDMGLASVSPLGSPNVSEQTYLEKKIV